MNFPAKVGGYPRAFLSLRKHAGYRSDRECDAGAYSPVLSFFGF